MRWLALLVVVAGCQRLFELEHFDHHPIDAPEPRPDLPVDRCGVVGAPCCATGSACTDGSACLTVAGHDRCVAFAGTFELNTQSACGLVPCLEDNRLSGACACPSGFTPTPFALDEGCGGPLTPTNQTAMASVCAISTMPIGSDYAGMYLTADFPACEPQATNGCTMPNPITGDCSCPPGVEIFRARVFVPGTLGASCTNGFLGGFLGVCLTGGVAQASLLGVYQLDADDTCRAHSSGLAGCACPAGALATQVRTIVEQQNQPMFAVIESTITFCIAPP